MEMKLLVRTIVPVAIVASTATSVSADEIQSIAAQALAQQAAKPALPPPPAPPPPPILMITSGFRG